MRRIVTKGLLLFIFLISISGTIWGQSQVPHVDLTVRFEASSNVYEVYAKSDSTLLDFYMGGGSQVSLVLPASIPDVTLNINSVVGGPWSDNSQIYAPSAQAGSDFHSITTNGTMPAQTYSAGTEVLLFTFTTPSGMCDGGLRLFRNNPESGNPADPDSNAPGMLGGDFLNYLGEVNTGDNYYKANYDNNGTSCGGNAPDITDIVTSTDLPEDSTVTVCTVFSDIDAGDTFVPGLCSAPNNGTASATISDSTLCITYTPSANFTGMDSVCVTVCDQLGNCDSTVVTFNVTPINDPPIAQNENVSTSEDMSVDVSLTVTDVDGPSANFSILDNPSNGTAIVNASGIATYTPNLNFVGMDTFSYVICDGGTPDLCDTAYVYITISDLNDSPVLTSIGTTFTPEDSTVTSCTPFSDPDIGDTHTASLCGTPNNGIATVAIVNGELCVTYTPNSGFSGSDDLCASVCDQAGNCDSTTFNILVTSDTVTISDACLTCPSAITANTSFGSCEATVSNLGQPLATGNCSAATMSNDATSNIFPLGQTTVVWTLIASNGSTATCSQVVEVQDNQAPQITCPANLTFNTNSGACSAGVSNLGTPGSSDNCGVDNVTNNHPNSTYSVGLTTVTWTAFDASGNTATCNQTVLVRDNDAPSIACPNTLTVTSDSSGCSATIAGLGSPNATDNCGVTSESNDHPSPTYSMGSTIVVWTASDATGNTASCTQEVVVTDGIAPSIVCPIPLVVDPASGSCTATVTNLGNASATDNCGNPTITNDVVSTTFQSGTTSVIWTAQDAGGLTATCEQIVLVRDNQLPTITCPQDITVAMDTANCFATINNIGQATGTDNCALATVTSNHVSPIYPVGNTTVIWTAVDVAANNVTCVQTVTVEDRQTPSVACPSNITTTMDNGSCTATISNLGTATGTDNCTVLSVTNNQTSSVFPSGTTTVVWTVIDAGSNAITCAQEVTVTDNQNPTIACPADVQVTAPTGSCDATVTGLGAPSTADNCSVSNVSNNQTSNSYPVGSATVVWTATDAGGNTATCAQTVIVSDGQIPTITCPANISVDSDNGSCDASVSNLGLPTTSDNCGVASTLNDAPSNSIFAAGANTVLWTVTDNGGNTATCVQTVTVSDNNAPSITCPNSMSVNTDVGSCSANISNIGNATTADNCGVASTLNDAPAIGDFAAGANTVTWTVSDNNGNTATCTQTVTVTDNVPPGITCPSNITNLNADPNACTATVPNLGTPATTDNCGLGALTNDQGTNVTYQTGTTTVIWTILDIAGNSATCAQTVTVSENEVPTITCPANIEVTADPGDCEATVSNLGTPMTTDNCGVNQVINNAGSPIYPAGVTTVTWTVNDDAGNTATCDQTITVLEIQPPTLACPPDFSVATDAGSCFATVNLQNAPAASDNCSINSLISDQAGVTTFALGANVLTWTATDVNGNSATCSYTMNVGYAAPFALDCPAAVTVDVSGNVLSDADNFLTDAISLAGCSNVALSYAQPTPNAQCGTISFTQTGPTSGSAFAVGTQTVTYTAEDEFDNETTCSVDITVQDMPSIALTTNGNACPGATVEISAPVIPNATYTWSGPGGNFPNTPSISISDFSADNEGFYDLSVISNGCELMSADMLNLVLDTDPLAQDDRVELVADVPMDSFAVLTNDMMLPASYTVTALNPVSGISYLNNGQFTYDGSLAAGTYEFDYEICSNTCIDFCDTAQVRMNVVETVCASIPNTISPNGDGVNDEFLIPCLETNAFPDNKLVIYNQWGDVVFKAEPYMYDPTIAFKGLYMNNDGQVLPDGAYYYIFQPSKTDKSINGYIQIFR